MEKAKKVFQVIFILIAILTIAEFLFIRGMFTSIIMMALCVLFGIINFIFELKDKNGMYAVNYIITTVALCMGYVCLMIGIIK